MLSLTALEVKRPDGLTDKIKVSAGLAPLDWGQGVFFVFLRPPVSPGSRPSSVFRSSDHIFLAFGLLSHLFLWSSCLPL